MNPAAREQEARQRAAQVSGAAFVTGGAGFAGTHLLELLPGATAPSREELDLLDAGRGASRRARRRA